MEANTEYFEKIVKNRFFKGQHPSAPEKQFVPIPFTVLDHYDFRKNLMCKKRFATYLWLRRKVIRGDCPLNESINLVFSNYFHRSKLAVAVQISKLAKDLGMSKSTVHGHIMQLEKDGLIQIEYHEKGNHGLECGYYVYVLGEIENNKEVWFLDEIYTMKRRHD